MITPLFTTVEEIIIHKFIGAWEEKIRFAEQKSRDKWKVPKRFVKKEGKTNVFILQMIKFNFPKSIGYLLLNNTRIKLNTTILKLMVTTNGL